MFVVFVLIFVLCSPLTASVRRDTGLPEWTFDDVADLADWRDCHNLSPASNIVKVKSTNGVERNVLRLRTTGDNPYIYPGGSVPNWESFSGDEHKIIYIGVRVKRSDTWQIDYVTGKSGSYEDAQSRKFLVNATPDFVDLEFDMQWESTIRSFRIHPGTNMNKVTEIDYLSLQGPVAVTKPPRKLATTWGRIKDLF